MTCAPQDWGDAVGPRVKGGVTHDVTEAQVSTIGRVGVAEGGAGATGSPT